MTEFPAHPFWDFALDVYRRPGVSDACLHLQEPYHLDVNLLLFCGWTGAFGMGRLSDEEIARCRDAVAAWHDSVVRGLRAVRRILKDGFPELPAELAEIAGGIRKQVQAREIDAEHLEQLILVGAVHRVPNDHLAAAEKFADAAANMAAYCRALDAAFDAGDRAALTIILNAMFPTRAAADAAAAIDAAAGV
ncbi:MAG: TIGR02444 family protein [Alphaproteobacteria bacterium]